MKKLIIRIVKLLPIFKTSHLIVIDDCKEVYNRSWTQPSILSWNNVHGYKVSDYEWWVAVNMRAWGISVQNVIIKCDSEKELNDWIWNGKLSDRLIDSITKKSKYQRGDTLDTCFRFNYNGESNDFNVNDHCDLYYETEWN